MENYTLGKCIGRGSFGIVLLCTRSSDSIEYVMKRLPIHNVTEKEMEAYQNEIRLLSELEHPGIVGYCESFVDRTSMDLCIVMQHCDGGDLSSFLKQASTRGVKLPEVEIKQYFIQMALALHYMHEKNILHRDLKSGNVFLRSNCIQLGDFGISKVLSGASDLASTCIGTPYYMSPELFKNKPYNHKSDVWALGVLLYELTSFRHAFDSGNINGLAQKVIHGVYPPISTNYSRDLRELIKMMLGVTPNSRPSMKQILLLPCLLKPLRKYIKYVLKNESSYRPAVILNLKNQLERIGSPVSGLFAEVEASLKSGGKSTASDANDAANSSSKKISSKKIASSAAGESELCDAEGGDSAIEKTLLAPPKKPSNRRAKGEKVSSKRNRMKKMSDIAANDSSSSSSTPSIDLLNAAEHAARLEELRIEEEAKSKLEQEFERLQALHTLKARQLAQKKKNAAASIASTETTSAASSSSSSASSNGTSSKENTISPGSSSSGSNSNLPIISSPAVQSLIHSPKLPISRTASPSPSTTATSIPLLKPSRRSGRMSNMVLPPAVGLVLKGEAAQAVMNVAPTVTNGVASSSGTTSAASMSPSGSVNGSHASSPRIGYSRRLAVPAASSSNSTDPQPQQQPTDSSPSNSSPTASPVVTPMDSLKLLKRKVAVARAANGVNGGGSFSMQQDVPNKSLSPSLDSTTSLLKRTARVRGGVGAHASPYSNTHTPPPPSTHSSDIASTLQHEKDELSRLKQERQQLEQILSKMDEEHGLFVMMEGFHGGSSGLGISNNHHSNPSLIPKSKSPLNHAASSSEDTSPRDRRPVNTNYTSSLPSSLSSTALPAAFDAPLLYKPQPRDRSAVSSFALASNGSPSNSSSSLSSQQKSLRRHSSNQNDAPIAPRQRNGIYPQSLSNSPSLSNLGGPLSSSNNNTNSSSNLGTKDRILAAKAAKKHTEAQQEQARLLQARREYFGDRLKAEQRTKEFYGYAAPAPTNNSSDVEQVTAMKILSSQSSSVSSMGYGHSPPMRDTDNYILYDDNSLATHFSSDLTLPTQQSHHSQQPSSSSSSSLLQQEEDDLSTSRMNVENFQQHLKQYTRRIEKLKSVIEVNSSKQRQQQQQYEEDGSDEDSNDSDSDEDGDDIYDGVDGDLNSPASPSIDPPHESLEERKKSLAQQCVNLVGRDVFVSAYDFLSTLQSNPEKWDDDRDDSRKIAQLTRIMGDKVKHWRLIDQLLFVESC